MDKQEYLELSRRLRATLTPADLDSTLAQITAAAVEALPDVDHASITIKHDDDRLQTVAPTDDLIWDLDAAQYEFHEGPCYEAATHTVHETSPDLSTESRWPRYAPVALSAGIRAQAAVRLFDATDSNGALNLYSLRQGAFADLDGLDELFAHQAATAIEYAREISQLKQAVETRTVIGRAVGIVMHKYSLDDARAFAFLARMSSTSNTKLRLVADEVINDATANRDNVLSQ
ncbi:ANTAR domain-containing protein [Nocardioides seonyuensis]|uniref:ANTAR domain-containing protein n=1 Tax=Nocardioides seonyuensis TaxID=2518371 RepID=A0A4P7IEB5_9ACTN|nr:GAF and ANTAR domain-containing protein [Nocardioides seonyuensis]QBX55050.1 ANTAR domain-containing protein [Nocardioides seonyuensis]